MSLFWVLFLAMVVSAFVEIFFQNNIKLGRILLLINLTLITLMLCFRYGEGSDYPTYQMMYNAFSNDTWYGFLDYADYTKYREVGYRFLSWLFSSRGVPFAVFAAIIAVSEAPLLYRFLDRYCAGMRCMGLLLLYPVFIFIYQFSGLRQGITIAVFLGLMLPLYERKKWVLYFLLAAFCVLFHRISLLFFLLPLAYFIKERIAEIILGGSIACSVAIGIYLYIRKGYWGISLSGYIFRIVILVIIMILYRRFRPTDLERAIYSILCLGMAGYALLSSYPLIAGRCYDEIRFLAVIPVISFLRGSKRLILLLGEGVLIFYTGFFLWKNLTVRCQSGMKDSVNAFNYPYITVFEKERLYDYYAGGQ